MDEQAFANIGSALSDITSTTPPPTNSGSFSYTPEALRDLINEWRLLADDYRASRNQAQYLTTVKGPGTEYVSQFHADTANTSGRAYSDSLNKKLTYCLTQVDKLQAALDSYLGVEHHNVTLINQTQPQDGI
jgi:hypothetical protein